MCNGDGSVAAEKKLGQRFADNSAATNYQCILTFDRNFVVVKYGHPPGGSSRHEAIKTKGQAADVHRVNAIYVLFGVEDLDHGVKAEVGRQRHLYDDACHLGKTSEHVQLGLEHRLLCFGRQNY